MKKFEKTWESKIVEHKGFRDLGNYVIELPDFTEKDTEEIGLALFNYLSDHGKLPTGGGCTAMVKRNKKGEVIIGRNMDLDISQSPAYVFKTTYGKYKNACVTYVPNFYKNYEEVKQLDELDPNLKKAMSFLACDCMNEKGLYVEMNLREKNEKMLCYGLHSSHGEKTRYDGKPWSELRACTTCIPQLVTQNCATVDEAIEFIKNSYDWYTVYPSPESGLANGGANMCFLIGDATGEYGLIELAQDEVSFIPYQYGQANFYITPKWCAMDAFAVGHGRLGMVSKVIRPVETLEEAMNAMVPIMWRNETLWIGESHRFTDGTHLHPYSQISFEDNQGKPVLDWRGDYIYEWPILEDGRLILDPALYAEAEKATYDPMIKKYYDEAISAGSLVVDDGSFLFDVCGKKVNLSTLKEKYFEYATAPADKKKELKPYNDAYEKLLHREDRLWAHDDDNFEALKAAAYATLHTRYTDDGKFDPSAMSKYEKLHAFYGFGQEKNEKPLRDDGKIWTTSLNVGVNCAQKELKIRFWENDEVIFHMQF
ncbi:MAG: linear amide C-N hydrolase [Sphaerochaetaceae bacterium]|nr:linear amide C-N hydrolase [Sphaerochaetaceae bacterium]